MKRAAENIARIPSRTQKLVQDTAAGCRELAAADLSRAALMDTANGRRRLETSASSWNSRADLIQRLDDGFAARQAVARAEWDDDEPAPKARKAPGAGDAT